MTKWEATSSLPPPPLSPSGRGRKAPTMELAEVLEKIGLTEKQAKVYLALLELGTASVQSIAGKADLKRPTTYLLLDELQKKALVSQVPRAKKTLFLAETPEHLLTELNRKQDLVKNFLPQLLALHNAQKEKPQVQLFTGRQGVRQIYEQIFSSNSVWFFGTTKEISKLDRKLLLEFVKRVRDQRLAVRDFLTRSPEDLAYAREAEKGENYEIRFLPAGKEFPTDSALFGEKVVFFSFSPQVFALLIKSREISHSLRSLYELAWQQAESLPKS